MKTIFTLFFLLLFQLIYANSVRIDSDYDKLMQSQNLINVSQWDSSILIDLKYATHNNFLKQNVYSNLKNCYLLKETSEKLILAQKLLKKSNSDFTLLVYDCARPRTIQYFMWEVVKNTPQKLYVASPITGSVHNYGAAVDLTIADKNKQPLDMGSSFDYFGELSEPRYEKLFLKHGKLSIKQIQNRNLLRKIMIQAGFSPIVNEWWHFDAIPLSELKTKFKIIP